MNSKSLIRFGLLAAATAALPSCFLLPEYDPIWEPAPTVDVEILDQGGKITAYTGIPLELTAQAQYSENLLYSWDLESDGIAEVSDADSPDLTTTLTTPGDFQAQLTVRSVDGALVATETVDLTVPELPATLPRRVLLESNGGIDCLPCHDLEKRLENEVLPNYDTEGDDANTFVLNYHHLVFGNGSPRTFVTPVAESRLAEFDDQYLYDETEGNFTNQPNDTCAPVPGAPRVGIMADVNSGLTWCGFSESWTVDFATPFDDVLDDAAAMDIRVEAELAEAGQSSTLVAHVSLYIPNDANLPANSTVRVVAYEDWFLNFFAPNNLKDLRFVVRSGMNFDATNNRWPTVAEFTPGINQSFQIRYQIPRDEESGERLWQNELGVVAFVVDGDTGAIINVDGDVAPGTEIDHTAG